MKNHRPLLSAFAVLASLPSFGCQGAPAASHADAFAAFSLTFKS